MTAPGQMFAAFWTAERLRQLEQDDRVSEDTRLALEVAALLRLAALDLLTRDQWDALAMIEAATRGGDSLTAAVAPFTASAAEPTGAIVRRWRLRLRPILLDALERAARAFGLSRIPERARVGFTASLVREAETRAATAALRIGQTTAARVETVLRELTAAGTPPTDPSVAWRVQNAVAGRTSADAAGPVPSDGPVSAVRATERAALVSKYEAGITARGAFLTANAAGFRRIAWQHRGAPVEPRPEHVALHGVVIRIGETFGRTGLRFPRDPDGDVSEVANCTCTALYLTA